MNPPLESVTIREQVLTRLDDVGWTADRRERELPISPGGLSVIDGRVRRGAPLRADIALMHFGRPIAVIECKRSIANVLDGVQQARRYARLLDVPLAYATNGRRIIEIDLRNETEHDVVGYRSPAEVWEFFRGAAGLDSDQAEQFFRTPYSRAVTDLSDRVKEPRYYQHVATQRLLSRIAAGERRLLVVLATGTGKTSLAAQLVHVLWTNCWPRGHGHPEDRPRVLYLADRDILVDQPVREWFRKMFGDDPITRVQGSRVDSKHLYFALYQALDQAGDDSEALFRQYDSDFFDLVIVDECHRGSAAESSRWRDVLTHFSHAVQLGMTATPVDRADAVTYQYFGNPIYTYSLRQGIEDGFLAPFEVIRARLDVDIDGVEVGPGVVDRDGQPVPEGTYEQPQFEGTLVLPERTREAARYLTEFLRRTGVTGKTIVFCQDQDHAARMRQELVNLNSDLLRAHGDEWVVRITANERDRKRLLGDFSREDSPTPVVAVTSQLMSTGVDVPTARTIVLFRRIQSMIEFKQIIGRGTRLAPDFGKEHFTVIDFVGATRKFEDKDFDGPPVRIIEATSGELDVPNPLDLDNLDVPDDEVAEPEADFEEQDGGELPDEPITDPDDVAGITRRSAKYVVDGYDVHVTSEQLYVMDVRNDRLQPVSYQQWVHDRVIALQREPAGLLEQWATARGRRELREMLHETLCFQVDELAARLRRPDCDPIDLLIYLGWEWPLNTRAERVAAFSVAERGYMDTFSPRARQILATLLEKYAAHGVDDLSAHGLQGPPLNEMGSVVELAQAFGGASQLHDAIDEMGRRLFVVS